MSVTSKTYADAVARISELEQLSVTNLMIAIVSGDGSGQEVYAKSVEEVEQLLSDLWLRVEDLVDENHNLRSRIKGLDQHLVRHTQAYIKKEGVLAESHAREMELRKALSELVDIVEDIRAGDYKPDSFTCQPAFSALSLPHDDTALREYGANLIGQALERMLADDDMDAVSSLAQSAEQLRDGTWKPT